jgi:hypothetical protein
MTSRVAVPIAALSGLVLGLSIAHPVAQAMSSLEIVACKGSAACIGGSNTGGGAAIKGTSGFGPAIVAKNTGRGLTSSSAIDASSVNSNGISATSQISSGVFGQTVRATNGSAGVYGLDTSGGAMNEGVFGWSTFGTGVYAKSNTGVAVEADTSADSTSTAAVNIVDPNGADLVRATGMQNSTFRVDALGNVRTSGLLYSAGSCASGCARRREQSYGATAAVPTIEDTGEARLIGGSANVAIDPAFANAIDARQGYVVLITPEGDTRGLFVARRTPVSFSIRETMGGRSTIGFGYRIVAHPYGITERRLPFVDDAKR